jgi:hypothetical protein
VASRRQPSDAARRPRISELTLGDEASLWEELGFAVQGETFPIGSVSVRLAGSESGPGIAGWSLREIRTNDLDGLPTTLSYGDPPAAPAEHRNGALSIDHVVVVTPSLDRTAAAFDDAGVPLRRVREAGSPDHPMRQGFLRLGEVIVELVQPPPGAEVRVESASMPALEDTDPARFWGLVFVVSDLDRLASALGDRLGAPRDAVQPGRRIATLQATAGSTVPVAFITPQPAPDPARR